MDIHGNTVAVARVTFGTGHTDNAVANAQLISAAPEMFAALLHVAQILEQPKLTERNKSDMQAIIHAAVHKTIMGGAE